MRTQAEKEELVRQVDHLREKGKTQAAACREVGISAASYRSWNASAGKSRRIAASPIEPRIFISHRHADSGIASALRRQLLLWGFADDQIFQSSHPKGGATIGESIKDSIRKALARAHLVVFIFTYERYDWQYCMWEVGVAMGAARDKTRIVVLRCFDDKPKVFAEDLVLAIDFNDMQKLVRQVHKEPNFFPGLPAYLPKIAGEASRDKSQGLYRALKAAADQVRITEEEEPTPRWGFITFSVDAATIKDLKESENGDRKAIRTKLERAARIVNADKEGLEHFGFADPKRELRTNLQHLVRNWKRTVKDSVKRDDWATDLCDDLCKAIQNQNADPSWRPFRSAAENAWVFPLVNLVRPILGGDMEFDVYVYKVPPPAA